MTLRDVREAVEIGAQRGQRLAQRPRQEVLEAVTAVVGGERARPALEEPALVRGQRSQATQSLANGFDLHAAHRL
jgi:hypothetical protein